MPGIIGPGGLPHRGGSAPGFVSWLANALVKQPLSDAYWSVTHPVDRLMGRGRAANGQMSYPLGPGRWAVSATERQFVNDLLKSSAEGPAPLTKMPKLSSVNPAHVGREGRLGQSDLVPVETPGGNAHLLTGFTTVPKWMREWVGPRKVGGVYHDKAAGETYRVVDIRTDPQSGAFKLLVESIPGSRVQRGRRWHRGAWDPGSESIVK